MQETEYIVPNPSYAGDHKKYASGGMENGPEDLPEILEGNGYAFIAEIPDTLLILQKGQAEKRKRG